VSRRKHHVSYWKDDKAYCDKKTDAKGNKKHSIYDLTFIQVFPGLFPRPCQKKGLRPNEQNEEK
jgi:hypothetical protein